MASPTASAMRAMISNAVTAAQVMTRTRNRQAGSRAARPPWLAGAKTVTGRPASPPMSAFTGRRTGLPLTGGQAQTFASGGTVTNAGVLNPAPFTTLAQENVPAGAVTVAWTVILSGTLSSADTDNFQLSLGAQYLVSSVNADTAGSYAQISYTLPANSPGGLLRLQVSLGTPTSGARYGGSLTIPGFATVQTGPQGAGTVWYPAQATISTTTGMTTGIDTAVCNVYLGAAGTPITLLATVFSGNGLVAAALPNLTVGQFIIAEWTGATPGDACALNVQGIMSTLVMP